MDENEELKEFKALLKNAKVGAELEKFLLSKDAGLAMECWQDLFGYVTEKSYEAELKQILDRQDTFKDQPLLVSRFRAAWRQCQVLDKELTQRKTAGVSQQDLDIPLDDTTKQELDRAWDVRYHLTAHATVHPADTLVSRKYREIKKNAHEVDDMRKMRTLFHASRPTEMQREKIGGETYLETGREHKVKVASVVDYYFSMRTWAHAVSKAGNHLADSKVTPGTKVQYADLSENLDYADQSLRTASALSLSEAAQLMWLEEVDLLTRATMVMKMRQGWPQTEALRAARREHAIDWKTPPITPNKRARGESPEPMSPDAKRQRNGGRTGLHYNGKEICKPHNDQRGCTKGEAQCPLHRLHVCDKVRPDGSVCGSRTHKRSQHH